MNENNEKLKAVLADDAFVKTLVAAEDAEAVQKLLADKGVDMTLGEIEIMGAMIEGLHAGEITVEQLEQLSTFGELSEDELAEAAGGGFWDGVTNFFSKEIMKYFDDTTEITRSEWMRLIAIDGGFPNEKYVRVAQWGNIGKTVACVAWAAVVGYGLYDDIRRRGW